MPDDDNNNNNNNNNNNPSSPNAGGKANSSATSNPPPPPYQPIKSPSTAQLYALHLSGNPSNPHIYNVDERLKVQPMPAEKPPEREPGLGPCERVCSSLLWEGKEKEEREVEGKEGQGKESKEKGKEAKGSKEDAGGKKGSKF
jgi:hypothetical protein